MIYEGKQTIFNHIEQNSLYNMILNEDETTVNAEKDGKSSISIRINKYLISSGLNDIFDILNIVCSLMMIGIHIFYAYLKIDQESLTNIFVLFV
jgi:hypothetical protein